MNLHEYQAKELLRSYGVPLLKGEVCYTPGEAERSYDLLDSPVCVVKAQILAGGRGKAGGVKLVRSSTEAAETAKEILGKTLVTPQTGAKGKKVQRVYIEAGCAIAKEFYVSLIVDRASQSISIVASTEGGMEIEEVAAAHPEKIHVVRVDPKVGLRSFHSVNVALKLGLQGGALQKFVKLMDSLYRAFIEKDCLMLEINPLVLTKDDDLIVLDAKCTVDGNALYRHPELARYEDYDDMDPKDLQASKHDLSYVALDGNIGCMVNGAGLAMGTMDIIKYVGGNPANFLDVGGGATKEKVTEAFRILLSDKQLKAIFVNIFGGIMRCDLIAQGIIAAAKELGVGVPLVVRLQGTNVEEGKRLLGESGLSIITAESMDDAARKVVAAAAGKS